MTANRFRFRAWVNSGKHSKMVQGVNPCGFLANADNTTLMQSTGLVDKNGKEIFEGDVVENAKGEAYMVTWNINGLWGYKRVSDNCFYRQDWWECEIIGNVHENPERLEA